MEFGTGFLVKLEPFLLMSKSAKGAAAAKLIQDTTSAPGVFVFGELLDSPNIQEVCTSDVLDLIFASESLDAGISWPIMNNLYRISIFYNYLRIELSKIISVRSIVSVLNCC
jgi:hypothetical protein